MSGGTDIEALRRGQGSSVAVPIVGKLRRICQAERDRWPLWIPVLLGGGVLIYFAFPEEPPFWWGLVLVGITVPLALSAHHKATAFAPGIVLVALLALGFAVGQVRTALVTAPILPKEIGPTEVSGQVLSVVPKGLGVRILLRDLTIERLPLDRTPKQVRLTHRGKGELPRPGDNITVLAKLRPPPPPAAPGAYDFSRDAFFKGIGGVGFTLGPTHMTSADTLQPGDSGYADLWRIWWSELRNSIAARVRHALAGDNGALAAALITGQRGALSEGAIQNMRDSGLAHLLAISGLHMGLVAGLFFFGLRALLALIPAVALTHPIKKWAAAAAILGAFGYLCLAGSSTPTQRAFVMVSLVMVAVLLDRRALSLRLVALAAMAILIVSPESLLSPGFQMSFAAVTALISAYEALALRRRETWQDRHWGTRFGYYVAGVALTSVIAMVATAPFAAFHFNRLAAFGLVANLVAVPLTAFWIMPWALVAMLLMPLGLEGLGLQPMGWGLSLLLTVAKEVASWPNAVLSVGAMPASAVVSIAFGGLWLCLWKTSWRFAGLAPVFLGLLLAATARPPDVLVSGEGKLMAIRGSGELFLSTRRSKRFDADIWARRTGSMPSGPWPATGQALGGLLRCDTLGCLHSRGQDTVAFLFDERALQEDCKLARVVISRFPLGRRACPDPEIKIGRFDLWANGAHALWLSEDRAAVRTVAEDQGHRPWSLWVRRGLGPSGVWE